MSLEETINEELKTAAKAGDKLRLQTIRSIRAAIIEFNKSGSESAMTADDELKLLLSQAKKRKDAIEMYEKGGRQELAEQESKELAIIEEFLPKQMSKEEVSAEVKKIIEATGATDMKHMGKVMGAAMKELKGKADGNTVQSIVKELLR